MLNFDEYKAEVIRHELGHWLVARKVGLDSGAVKIKILQLNHYFGHEGSANILPATEFLSVTEIYNYAVNRICVLFAGVRAQVMKRESVDSSVIEELLETTASDDCGKIAELRFVVRGIKFAGNISTNNELEQINKINIECWAKTDALVESVEQLIEILSDKISDRVVKSNVKYIFGKDEMESWVRESGLGADLL